MKRICLTCNNTFKAFPSLIKNKGGKYCSRPCYWQDLKVRPSLRKGKKSPKIVGSLNHMWIKNENNLTYIGIHAWIYRNFGKATYCENNIMHNSKRFEWANISGKYKRDRFDWKQLCSQCHSLLDNKSGKMKEIRKNQEIFKYLVRFYLGKRTIPYTTQKKHDYLSRMNIFPINIE